MHKNNLFSSCPAGKITTKMENEKSCNFSTYVPKRAKIICLSSCLAGQITTVKWKKKVSSFLHFF